ncbi:MAG TPA: hypothetical protein VHX61_05330 [Rhizomicrobium sp.]|jgi:uncharacterized repeat protein (TIGR03803 family)|nr:hypothetical protein [Rhizomicrobium sp.]
MFRMASCEAANEPAGRYAGVTIEPATGDIYGSTIFGGDGGCRNGCGVLYRLAPDGAFTVLHTFKGGKGGQYPAARLIRGQRKRDGSSQLHRRRRRNAPPPHRPTATTKAGAALSCSTGAWAPAFWTCPPRPGG